MAPLTWRRLPDRIAYLIVAHPWACLGLVLVLGGVAAMVASSLRFNAQFSALLPEDAPELLEVREVQKRAGGTVEMVIAVSGGDEKKRLAFARELVAKLKHKAWVQRANVEFPVEFFRDRRMLLLPEKKLRQLQETIDEEIERAKARANPLYVDLEDDEDQEKPWSEVDRTTDDKLPRRTFTSSDGQHLFVRIKPEGSSSDMGGGKVVLSKIKETVSLVGPERRGVEVRYAGGLVANQEQHSLMTTDLKRASLFALGLILVLLTMHIRRMRAPLILVVPLIIGVTITLAITALTVGQLNLISGFLVSALLGIGIDFEIHLYLRYLELLTLEKERRQAMRHAIAATLPPCVTSAATTAAAFFAMTVSDFRGFREYGQIAGIGVLVTLAISFLALPPLALLVGSRGKRPKPVGAYAGFHPRLAWTMVIAGTAALVFSIFFGQRVRWYNDFHQLRGDSEAARFSQWVSGELGGSLSPAAILVRNLEEARRVERYLEPLTKDPTSGVKKYISLASMVPRQAEKKLPILKQIESSLEETLEGKLKPEDRKRVEEGIELARVRPWTVDEIPGPFREQFTTVDGKGQFVVVWTGRSWPGAGSCGVSGKTSVLKGFPSRSWTRTGWLPGC
jgi:predicted RND superfamily exporter protein